MNKLVKGGVAALAVSLSLAGCAGTDGGESDDSVTLRFAAGNPENSLFGDVFNWWMDEITERTDGEVEWERYFGGSLIADPDMLMALGDGRADVGNVSGGLFPQELPLYQAAGIPFVTSDSEASVQALTDLLSENEEFQQEFEDAGVKPAFFTPAGAGVIGMDGHVESIDDLSGKRLRSFGYSAIAIEAVGGTPVSTSFAELYESVQRSVVDGYAPLILTAVTDLSLHEIHPTLTSSGLGVYSSGATAFSTQAWDDLSPEHREVVEEVSAEAVAKHLELMADADEAACDALLEAGGSVTMLPEAEVEKWQTAVGDQVLEQFESDVAGAGGSTEQARAFYDDYVERAGALDGAGETVDSIRACADRS